MALLDSYYRLFVRVLTVTAVRVAARLFVLNDPKIVGGNQ